MTEQELKAAQECVNIIQQKAAVLNSLGWDVSGTFDDMRDLKRAIVLKGALHD